MNEFENKLIIKEEAYQKSLFPTVPKFDKRGSVFILTEGICNDIAVNEHTTTKEIRQGKYTKLVEISILPYMKEIRFCSPSKENAYSFDIYVKAVIQVIDPILFYQNKNIDVDAYFDNLFSLDVRKITKCYSILDYDGMDEELTKKLSSHDTIDEPTGFSYRISVVDATPGEKAQHYVQQYSQQLLDAGLKENARKLTDSYTTQYKEAIRTEIAEGKISEADGILKIEEYNKMNYESKLKHIEELRKSGLLTDREARGFVAPALNQVGVLSQTENFPNQNRMKEIDVDSFYPEDEE